MVAAISCLLGNNKDEEMAIGRHVEVRGIWYLFGFCFSLLCCFLLLYCEDLVLVFDDGGKMFFLLCFCLEQWFYILEMLIWRLFQTSDLWGKIMIFIVVVGTMSRIPESSGSN